MQRKRFREIERSKTSGHLGQTGSCCAATAFGQHDRCDYGTTATRTIQRIHSPSNTGQTCSKNRPQGRSKDQLERRIVRDFTGGGAAAERLALVGTGGRKAAVCVEDVGVGTDMLCDGTAR